MDNVRKSFHQTLEEIRQEMVQMAALVTEGIPRATEALLAGDLTDAQKIIEGDDPLDVGRQCRCGHDGTPGVNS